jgi:hypothetical protein
MTLTIPRRAQHVEPIPLGDISPKYVSRVLGFYFMDGLPAVEVAHRTGTSEVSVRYVVDKHKKAYNIK